MTPYQPPRQQQQPMDYYNSPRGPGGHVLGQPLPAPPQKPKRKRRVFLWVFLAVQVLFIIWLVTGLATVHSAPSTAQIAQVCGHHGWFPLFKSHADCVTHYGGALTDAGNAGKAIGAGLIVLFWVVVDFFLGLGYGIYRLASR
jgi:hypothetical protein